MEWLAHHAPEARRQGFKKVGQGGLGFAAGMLLVVLPLYALHDDPLRFGPFPFLVATTPIVWAAVGLAEAASGRPFSGLAGWWDGLRIWQRGLLAAAVVLAFVAALLLNILAVLG